MIEPILKAQLERDEGRLLTAYKDTAGYWTIGVGHLLGPHARMTVIRDDECDALLARDVEDSITALTRVFGDDVRNLDAPRFRAMVNMAFNRGERHMRDSTTITPAIKYALHGVPLLTDDWKPVSDAILASPWAKQIGARAVRLAKQFETGSDQ